MLDSIGALPVKSTRLRGEGGTFPPAITTTRVTLRFVFMDLGAHTEIAFDVCLARAAVERTHLFSQVCVFFKLSPPPYGHLHVPVLAKRAR